MRAPRALCAILLLASAHHVQEAMSQANGLTQESFEPVAFPPAQPVVAGETFIVSFRSSATAACRGVPPPLVVVFVRSCVCVWCVHVCMCVCVCACVRVCVCGRAPGPAFVLSARLQAHHLHLPSHRL